MDKNYNFFALAARMKYINRWGLMKNTQPESIGQHSLDTAVIAHGLAVINNKIFSGNIDAEKTALVAMFHDISEIITGDMPTPIKYYNSDIMKAYKEIEKKATESILEKLPEELRDNYVEAFVCEDKDICRIVKAADKLSAYIKCIEEENAGNSEFKKAKESIMESIKKMNLPEADYFMEKFIPAFYLTLDEI